MPWWLLALLPIALFLVGLVLYSLRSYGATAFQFLSAPLRSDVHGMLSLARILLVTVIIIGQLPAMFHDWFWKYGGVGAVIVEVIALYADITTSKTGAAVLQILAGKNNVSLAGVPGIVSAMPCGGNPDPAATPEPEATAKVPDDATDPEATS